MKPGEKYVPRITMTYLPSIITVKAIRNGMVGYSVNDGNVIWAREEEFRNFFLRVSGTTTHQKSK